MSEWPKVQLVHGLERESALSEWVQGLPPLGKFPPCHMHPATKRSWRSSTRKEEVVGNVETHSTVCIGLRT